MKKRVLLAAAFTAFAMPMAGVALAQETGAARGADSHVHGLLNLVVSVEGDTAIVELESPMWNLVGFEHAPTNEIEADKWVATATRLKTPDRVVSFPQAAGCALEIAELGPFGPAAGLTSVNERDGDSGHTHDHGAAHDHDHDHDENGGHSDIVLTWSFHCDSPRDVRSVVLPLFDSFPQVERADAVLFTDAGQVSAQLTTNARTLRLQ